MKMARSVEYPRRAQEAEAASSISYDKPPVLSDGAGRVAVGSACSPWRRGGASRAGGCRARPHRGGGRRRDHAAVAGAETLIGGAGRDTRHLVLAAFRARVPEQGADASTRFDFRAFPLKPRQIEWLELRVDGVLVSAEPPPASQSLALAGCRGWGVSGRTSCGSRSICRSPLVLPARGVEGAGRPGRHRFRRRRGHPAKRRDAPGLPGAFTPAGGIIRAAAPLARSRWRGLPHRSCPPADRHAGVARRRAPPGSSASRCARCRRGP